MSVTGHDTLKARRTLKVNGKEYDYFSLEAAAQAAGLGDIGRAAVLAQGAAGEPGAAGERPHGQGRRHQGGGGVAEDAAPPSARSRSARRGC